MIGTDATSIPTSPASSDAPLESRSPGPVAGRSAPHTPDQEKSKTRIDGSMFPNKDATTHQADPAEATQ